MCEMVLDIVKKVSKLCLKSQKAPQKLSFQIAPDGNLRIQTPPTTCKFHLTLAQTVARQELIAS